MSRAAAHGAGDDAGTFFGAGAVAFVAGIVFMDFDLFFDAGGCFFEGNFEVVAEVVSALAAAGFGGSSKELLEDAAGAEDFAENVEGVVEFGPGSGVAAATDTEGVVSVAVVGGTFFGVGEDFVGFAEFFEKLFCLGVIGVFIGVVFDCESAVSLFDFLGGCVSGNP